jgi:hypothetical protein
VRRLGCAATDDGDIEQSNQHRAIGGGDARHLRNAALLQQARLGCCMASAFRVQSDGNVTAIWFKFDEKRQVVEESSRDTGIEDAFVTNFGTESQYVLTPLQKFFQSLGLFEIVCESCKVANCKAGAHYHCAPVQKPRRTPYALMSRDSDESRRAMCAPRPEKNNNNLLILHYYRNTVSKRGLPLGKKHRSQLFRIRNCRRLQHFRRQVLCSSSVAPLQIARRL